MRGRYRFLVVVLLGVWLSGPDAAGDAHAAERTDVAVGSTDASRALPAQRIATARGRAEAMPSSFRYVAVRR